MRPANEYLLAENSLADNDELVIIRQRNPIAHFRVLEGHLALGPEKHYRHFSHNSVKYTLLVTHYFTSAGVNQLAGNVAAIEPPPDISETIQKEIRNAWHWYEAYLKASC